MKKIGMITFHESDNYGTVLQAYALQHTIKKIGYEAEILNYQRGIIVDSKKSSFISKIWKTISLYSGVGIFHFPIIKQCIIEKSIKFKEFREKYLNRSDIIFESLEEIQKYSMEYDAFICGSDMIWSTDRSNEIEVFFLVFAPKEKRVAYAPSFGRQDVDNKYIDIYRDYINDMRFLSCREMSGIKLIKNLTEREADFVLDPTLLINGSEWSKLFSLEIKANPYVLCYLFENEYTKVKSVVNTVAKRLGCGVRIIPMTVDDYMMNNNNKKNGIGPIEFLKLFSEASFVFTNSYHGLLFSFIFNKSFYVLRRNKFGQWHQFEDRLESILSILNLKERIISDNTELDNEELEIEYGVINKKINQLRKNSVSYLEKALNVASGG